MSPIQEVLSMGGAGLVGILILIIGFHYLFLRLHWDSIIILLLVGGIIPMVITKNNLSLSFLFTAWQTAVLSVLGYRIYLAGKEENLQVSSQQQ